MKHSIVLYTLFLLLSLPVAAQTGFTVFMDSVLANNKSLLSAMQLADVEKAGARAGIFLSNPSVSYDKLNSASGTNVEMLVSQSFDFPSVYLHKRNVANLSALQADLKFQIARLEIMRDAATVYAGLVSANRKLNLLQLREQMLGRLLKGSQVKLKAGESNIFEANRIRSEAAKVKSELLMLEATRKVLLQKASVLNGGISLQINDTVVPALIPETIADTLTNMIVSGHPLIRFWDNEAQIATRNVLVQKSLSLPTFEAGYRQDNTTGQVYRGFHAGMTIPLFERKNTVRTAKAKQWYVKQEVIAQQVSLRNSAGQLVAEYVAAKQVVSDMKSALDSLNTSSLLIKSYQAGQIDYTEFFSEYDHYMQNAWYLEELTEKVFSLQLQLFILCNQPKL